MLAVALALAGCSSTIDAWRAVNGTDIDDPDPKTAPFTGNMATAYDKPYPNLASVPPPPTAETSTAERQKLAQTLIAERTATAALGGPPAAAPPRGTPVASPTLKTATAGPAAPAAGGDSAAARQPGEPPELQPLNSTLAMPAITTPLPQPQTPQPPPSAPKLAVLPPIPAPAVAAPAEAPAIAPAPAPPVPVLPPVVSPPAALKPPPKPAPVVTTVATLDMAAADTATSDADRAQIARVVALYKQKPGTVRIVALAAAPPPGGDPLALYRAALDRAQGVARALAAEGVPAGKIQTEATPASGPQTGRVEIELLP